MSSRILITVLVRDRVACPFVHKHGDQLPLVVLHGEVKRRVAVRVRVVDLAVEVVPVKEISVQRRRDTIPTSAL